MKKLLIILSVVVALSLTACGDSDGDNVDNNNSPENPPAENNNNINDNNDNNNENDDNTDNDNHTNNNDAENSEENEQTNVDLGIGDTVEYGGFIITLNEVRNEPGGDFDEPSEDLFVVANFTVENTTEEEQPLSSIIHFKLKDEDGYSYTTTFLVEGTKGQLDGSNDRGRTMRGEIPFDVPETQSYELHFTDPFASGKAIWKFSLDELE